MSFQPIIHYNWCVWQQPRKTETSQNLKTESERKIRNFPLEPSHTFSKIKFTAAGSTKNFQSTRVEKNLVGSDDSHSWKIFTELETQNVNGNHDSDSLKNLQIQQALDEQAEADALEAEMEEAELAAAQGVDNNDDNLGGNDGGGGDEDAKNDNQMAVEIETDLGGGGGGLDNYAKTEEIGVGGGNDKDDEDELELDHVNETLDTDLTEILINESFDHDALMVNDYSVVDFEADENVQQPSNSSEEVNEVPVMTFVKEVEASQENLVDNPDMEDGGFQTGKKEKDGEKEDKEEKDGDAENEGDGAGDNGEKETQNDMQPMETEPAHCPQAEADLEEGGSNTDEVDDAVIDADKHDLMADFAIETEGNAAAVVEDSGEASSSGDDCDVETGILEEMDNAIKEVSDIEFEDEDGEAEEEEEDAEVIAEKNKLILRQMSVRNYQMQVRARLGSSSHNLLERNESTSSIREAMNSRANLRLNLSKVEMENPESFTGDGKQALNRQITSIQEQETDESQQQTNSATNTTQTSKNSEDKESQNVENLEEDLDQEKVNSELTEPQVSNSVNEEIEANNPMAEDQGRISEIEFISQDFLNSTIDDSNFVVISSLPSDDRLDLIQPESVSLD